MKTKAIFQKTAMLLAMLLFIMFAFNACSTDDNDDNDDDPAPVQINIGDYRDGGVVFSIDETGQHGLVTAVSNFPSKCNWHVAKGFSEAYNITVEGVLYDDWFLPSKDQLNQMYINKATIDATAKANGGEIFLDYYYWSSTSVYNYYEMAWTQEFETGVQFLYVNLDGEINARAVRAF